MALTELQQSALNKTWYERKKKHYACYLNYVYTQLTLFITVLE